MFAFNPGDRHTYNFEEKVLPLAVERVRAMAPRARAATSG